jgi:hypothetical protein
MAVLHSINAAEASVWEGAEEVSFSAPDPLDNLLPRRVVSRVEQLRGILLVVRGST